MGAINGTLAPWRYPLRPHRGIADKRAIVGEGFRGLPWFMALFGHDSLITSYQMLPFSSELPATTLRADAQGKTEVELTEEEPGCILHELRFGEMTPAIV